MRAICRALNPHDSAARRVTKLLADTAGNIGTAQLKPLQIELIVESWHRLEHSTRRTYVHHLRKLLHVLDRDDLAPARVKQRVKHYPAATDQEIDRLINAASPWLRAALIIARDTGLRRADVLALTENHIREGTLTIVMQKTKQPVSIPVSPDLARLINGLTPDDPQKPILERVAGHPIGIATLESAWATTRRRAQVRPEIKLHSLRHAIALKLYQQTKDLTAVQQLLGHERLASTAGYLEHKDPKRIAPLISQMWTPKGPVQ